MAKAGYCVKCKRLVWLKEDGSCINGHPPGSVTDGCELEERAETAKAKPTIEGERKQITVLFSDLSGYTAMSEKLDPEEVKEVMSRIFGETAQIVAKYEGYIDKFIGDAVMVLFGYPKIHEDDPIRAIKVAMEIHESVEKTSPELEDRIGRPVSMHTGIDTGLVVTGEIDLERGTERVLGDTINVASRLTGLAKAGEIFVGKDTYHQAEGYFNFETLGSTRVEGKQEPIQAYKVLSAKEKPITVRHPLGLRAELIGRKVEMAQLREAAHKLQGGKGTVISICGEAGTGESRLVEELKATLDLNKIQWREGHCYAYSQNIPYFPLIDLFGRAWQIEEGDSPEKVKEKVESNIERLLGKKEGFAPYIGSLYGLEYSQLKDIDPESWKSRLYDALMAVLSALTQRAPTIIFLEDIHWADPSSLELLRLTFKELKSPALFLCVYRPPFTLFNSQQLNNIDYSYQEIQLKGLSPTETEEMMESLLKTKNIPLELKQFVEEKAEGNPFYLEEVISSLIESDILVPDNGSWKLTKPISGSNIPLTINGVISARLDHLEEDMKRILQEAAVIGRTFPYEILKRITELKEQLDNCLNGLERLDLIRTKSLEPELEYTFKHALTQEVVYGGLLKKEREEVHEKAALVIEELFHDRLPEFYETLAFHFKQGKSLRKAVDYLMKSGEKALSRYAVEEAHQYHKEAFGLLSNKPDKTHEEEALLIDLINKWALVYLCRGDWGELLELLVSHESLAKSLEDKESLGSFYSWLGMTLWAREKLKNSYRRQLTALHLGEEIGNQKVVGYACARLSLLCPELGFLEEAVVYAERAQEIALSLKSDHYLFTFSFAYAGYANWARGDKKKTDKIAKTLLEYGQRYSNIRSLAFGHWVSGFSSLIDGDFSKAIKHFQKAIQISTDPWFVLFPTLFLGMSYVLNGQFQEAEEPLQFVLSHSQRLGAETLGTPAQALLGVVLATKGQLSQGLRMIEDTRQLWLGNEGKWRYALSEYLLGNVYLQIAERASPISLSTIVKNISFVIKHVPFASKKAGYHFNKGIELSKEIGAKSLIGQAYLSLGQLYKAKGRQDKARECISKAIQYFEQCEAETYLKQAKEALDSLE